MTNSEAVEHYILAQAFAKGWDIPKIKGWLWEFYEDGLMYHLDSVPKEEMRKRLLFTE